MKVNDTGLKVAYKAPNELMANTIKALLESEGIDAIIRSFQIAMYDSIAMMMKPNWGEVLVRPEDLERAEELVQGFLASAIPDETEPSEDSNDL
jgi:hypothetical protein